MRSELFSTTAPPLTVVERIRIAVCYHDTSTYLPHTEEMFVNDRCPDFPNVSQRLPDWERENRVIIDEVWAYVPSIGRSMPLTFFSTMLFN